MSANEEGPAGPTGTGAIITERPDDHLLIIRIHRPHRRNAFDRATAQVLETVIDTYEDDRNLRCAILTGSDIAFSAGQDPPVCRWRSWGGCAATGC